MQNADFYGWTIMMNFSGQTIVGEQTFEGKLFGSWVDAGRRWRISTTLLQVNELLRANSSGVELMFEEDEE